MVTLPSLSLGVKVTVASSMQKTSHNLPFIKAALPPADPSNLPGDTPSNRPLVALPEGRGQQQDLKEFSNKNNKPVVTAAQLVESKSPAVAGKPPIYDRVSPYEKQFNTADLFTKKPPPSSAVESLWNSPTLNTLGTAVARQFVNPGSNFDAVEELTKKLPNTRQSVFPGPGQPIDPNNLAAGRHVDPLFPASYGPNTFANGDEWRSSGAMPELGEQFPLTQPKYIYTPDGSPLKVQVPVRVAPPGVLPEHGGLGGGVVALNPAQLEAVAGRDIELPPDPNFQKQHEHLGLDYPLLALGGGPPAGRGAQRIVQSGINAAERVDATLAVRAAERAAALKAQQQAAIPTVKSVPYEPAGILPKIREMKQEAALRTGLGEATSKPPTAPIPTAPIPSAPVKSPSTPSGLPPLLTPEQVAKAKLPGATSGPASATAASPSATVGGSRPPSGPATATGGGTSGASGSAGGVAPAAAARSSNPYVDIPIGIARTGFDASRGITQFLENKPYLRHIDKLLYPIRLGTGHQGGDRFLRTMGDVIKGSIKGRDAFKQLGLSAAEVTGPLTLAGALGRDPFQLVYDNSLWGRAAHFKEDLENAYKQNNILTVPMAQADRSWDQAKQIYRNIIEPTWDAVKRVGDVPAQGTTQRDYFDFVKRNPILSAAASTAALPLATLNLGGAKGNTVANNIMAWPLRVGDSILSPIQYITEHERDPIIGADGKPKLDANGKPMTLGVTGAAKQFEIERNEKNKQLALQQQADNFVNKFKYEMSQDPRVQADPKLAEFIRQPEVEAHIRQIAALPTFNQETFNKFKEIIPQFYQASASGNIKKLLDDIKQIKSPTDLVEIQRSVGKVGVAKITNQLALGAAALGGASGLQAVTDAATDNALAVPGASPAPPTPEPIDKNTLRGTLLGGAAVNAPTNTPPDVKRVAASVWDNLGAASKLLVYGGLSLTALSTLYNIFGKDEDDDEDSVMNLFSGVAPFLGLGMAGVGMLGSKDSIMPDFSQLGTEKFWSNLRNDASSLLEPLGLGFRGTSGD